MKALLCGFLFGLVVFLCLPMPARAQAPPPITMSVSSPLLITEKPLLLHRRQGRWFPIAVTLSNTGDPIKGRLALRLTASSGFERPTSRFYTDIDLPRTARKRVWLYGRIERDETDGFEVSLSGRGFATMTVKGRLADDEPGRRTVLTVSASDERLAFLSTTRGNGLALTDAARDLDEVSREQIAANPVRALGARREMVPDRWFGLDAVDNLVLLDFSHNALSPEQLDALRGYVAAGGVLVVPGGADWQRLAQSPLSELWPFSPQSSGAASTDEVAFLAREYVPRRVLSAADRLGGAPVVVQRGSRLPGAQTIVATSAGPLMVKARRGAGMVIWLAFDPSQPPFVSWDGQAKLWAQIFQQHAPPSRIQSVARGVLSSPYNPNIRYNYGQSEPDMTTGVLRHALASAPQLRTPPVSYIVWFLALYIFCLVPLNYAVLRFFDRREWAWVTIPIVVLAFSGLSYAAALRIKGNTILTRQINIVQSSAASSQARADAMLWLFSPRRTTYSIRSTQARTAIGDYVDNDEEPGITISQPDPRSSLVVQDAPVKMWDWKTFVGHSVVSAGQGISLSAGTVKNNTPFHLRGAVLVRGSRADFYGDIKPGATARPTENQPLIYKGSGSADKQVLRRDPQILGVIQRLSGADKLFPDQGYGSSSETVNAMLSLALDQGRRADGTFLVAWSDQLPAALKIGEESPRAQQITLFIFRL